MREMYALEGLSPLAKALYQLLLSWMDAETGCVGLKSGFAMADLRTELETVTPKGKGVMREKPTEQQLKTAVANLTGAGLIKRQGGEYVVFLLPMAVRLKARPKQTQRIPNEPLSTERNAADASNGAGFDGESNGADDGWIRANPTHIKIDRCTPSQSSSTTGREVARGDATKDAAPGGLDRDRPTGSQAGSAGGRSGDVGGESDCDRPAASHPAQERRLGSGAEAGGASDRAGGAERLGLSAEDESSRGVSASTGAESVLVEVLRREAIRVPQGSEDLAQWVADAVTRDELVEAIRRARAWRARAESVQPVNVGYLGQILRTMRSEARRAVAAPPRLDVSTESGLEALARSLGLWPARPGEDWGPYRQRVMAAARAKDGAAGGGDGGVE